MLYLISLYGLYLSRPTPNSMYCIWEFPARGLHSKSNTCYAIFKYAAKCKLYIIQILDIAPLPAIAYLSICIYMYTSLILRTLLSINNIWLISSHRPHLHYAVFIFTEVVVMLSLRSKGRCPIYNKIKATVRVDINFVSHYACVYKYNLNVFSGCKQYC